MTWTAQGSLGSGQSKTAGTTVALTTGATCNVGDFVVVLVAKDNASAVDANTNEVTAVANSGTANTWTKAREYCNGQTGAALGATVAVFYSRITASIASGGTITATHGSVTARAITAYRFTPTSANTVVVDGTPLDSATDASQPASVDVPITSDLGERLVVRAFASEDNVSGLTPTTGWTATGNNGTTGGASATNMGVEGEFLIVDISKPWYKQGAYASGNSYRYPTWNGSIWVALASAGGTTAQSSTDGITWTNRTVPNITYGACAWGNSVFVAVGANLGPTTTYCTSTNGTTWTTRALPTAISALGMAFDGTQFVAINCDGSGTTCLSSTDGITWAQSATQIAGFWAMMIWTGSKFVAVQSGATDAIMTSPDGVTWTASNMPSSVTWKKLASRDDGTVVCVGGNSTNAAVSRDHGVTWVNATLPTSQLWTDVFWDSGAGLFFAWGDSTAAAVSYDGSSWVAYTLGAMSGQAGGSAAYNGTRRVLTANFVTAYDTTISTQPTLTGGASDKASVLVVFKEVIPKLPQKGNGNGHAYGQAPRRAAFH